MSRLNALWKRAETRHIPISVLFEVTYRCNLACLHCYLHEGPADRPRPPKGELVLEEFQRILGELAEAESMFVTFTGGEVFLRRDFLEIVAHARALGLCVTVFTTGTVMTPEHAERLAALRPFAVEASVYSRNPEVHDAITKIPGSHRRTLEALRRLRAHGVQIVIKSSLMSLNAGEYRGLVELAEELGAQYGFDPAIVPRRNGDRTPLQYSMSREQIAAFANDPVLGEIFDGGRIDQAPCGSEAICSIGQDTCRISPYGEVFGCVVNTRAVGNLRKQSFREIWETAPYFQHLRSLTIKDLRLDPARPSSGEFRCSTLAEIEDGDFLGPFKRGERFAEAFRQARSASPSS